ncbi:flagellar hook protein FlgE [Pectinatus haikarae]|uniref:Flagellar hook protein FlgE n=1 Tax=Pectinatus haikarae TaxID=349096 RepID=A0ABT9Y9I7_9FIRM|nr:flagellar hook protein FlgE [Pectinatus haikarae]MDQ0203774.1 flagellar hook protein FlgE [Pectinatus haikarae]
MMRSLMTAVSGLKNHQTRMDVIGNDIANVNTTGYKSNTVTFADTLSQTLSGSSSANGTTGGVNAKQIGLGMSVAAITNNFTAGSASSTGNNTDLAIDTDNGLFVVKNGDETYYTRNGNFTLDSNGNLTMNGNGYYVQGWNAVDGSVNASGSTQNLKIDMNSSMQPKATSTVTLSGNLSADNTAETIKGIKLTLADGTTQTVDSTDTTTAYGIGDSYTYTDSSGNSQSSAITAMTLTLSDGTTTTSSSGVYGSSYTLGGTTYPSYTTTATVYDSLGASHSIPVSIEQTGSDTWKAVVAPGTYDGLTVTAASTTNLTFDGSTGKLTSGDTGSITGNTYNNGATQNANMSLDFSSLTQYSGENNASATGDGYAAGFYKEMSIGQDGVITVTYTNGQKQSAGQIAIATFNNPSGLEKSGGSLYSQSNNSGTARVGTFASQAVTVTPGSLEMSNVDLSTELSDMIITQRGFQANSKMITVSDEMLQTLINMKQS